MVMGVSLPQKCPCLPSAISLIHRRVLACSEQVSVNTDPLPALWPLLKSGKSYLWMLRALRSQSVWLQGLGAVLLNTAREMQLSWGRASPAQLLHAPPEVWELPAARAAIASPTQVWITVLFAGNAAGCHLVWPIVYSRLARKPETLLQEAGTGSPAPPVVRAQPLHLSRVCQPGCLGPE